jgi:hypothetical protein
MKVPAALVGRRAQIAGVLLSLDGVLIGLTGVLALVGAFNAFQGEEVVLFIAGLALLAFGVMVVFRWNLPAVKTGLAGMTAGYFASALTEFEVRTDPCDIGSTLARCADHVPGGTPWEVYQGPVFLAALLFFLLALEPYATRSRDGSD